MSSTITALTSGGGIAIAGDTSGQLELKTNNGTTAVTIDASQNVLIGGTTFDNGGFSGGANGLNVVDATHPIVLIKESTTGTKAFFATSSTLSYLWTPSNVPFAFGTNDTERMRIDSSGNLLVGTTSTSANPRTVLYGGSAAGFVDLARAGTSLNDVVNFSNANGVVGTIRTTGSSTQYNTSSDYRLKEDIKPMTGALDVVMRQRPVTYKWKSDGSEGQGFIAHWLQEDGAGGCVSGEKDAVNEDGTIKPQGIDTSFLVATLTAAIQEQQALITDLTTRLVALESK